MIFGHLGQIFIRICKINLICGCNSVIEKCNTPEFCEQGLEVRRIRPDEIERSLPLLLAEAPSSPASASVVAAFERIARLDGYDLGKQMVVAGDGGLAYACLFVPRPGGAAFVFTGPAPAVDDEFCGSFELAAGALSKLIEWARRDGCNLLQVLADPSDRSRAELSLKSGFRRLTDLIYLIRDCSKVAFERPLRDDLSWLEYGPENHELFKSTILSTYRDSLDCPELENLRDIEDIIVAHKSAGDFDCHYWKLLLCDSKPAGVLLLSPLSRQGIAELTYMGLCPDFRGYSLGRALINEAITLVGASGLAGLTLAVDCRNYPACRLYASCDFSEILRRSVYYYSSGW